MGETNQSAPRTRTARETRVNATLRCHVVVNGRKMRSVRITNLSKSGLLLSGNGGMYLRAAVGDTMVVYTELDGVKLHLAGTVVRFTPENLWRKSDHQIALRDVKWFQGWESDAPEEKPDSAALSATVQVIIDKEPFGIHRSD